MNNRKAKENAIEKITAAFKSNNKSKNSKKINFQSYK